jgi:hypothetical protein
VILNSTSGLSGKVSFASGFCLHNEIRFIVFSLPCFYASTSDFVFCKNGLPTIDRWIAQIVFND